MNSQALSTRTIDVVEQAKFEQLAESWWDPAGPFWPLHTLNKLRVDWVKARICESLARAPSLSLPLRGLRVLDVGCGGGILSESLAELGADVCGIDTVEKNISIASRHAAKRGLKIDYRHCSVDELTQQELSFDFVFNMEVVEHVANLGLFMQACNYLVKPGGGTFVATINRNPLAWFIAIFGAEQVLGWLPKGTHRYSMLRKPSELYKLLNRGGLVVREITGVKVNPVTKQMALSQSLSVNYMLYALREPSHA